MDAFEIAWFSSAFVFAYWVYAYEPLEPSKRPKKRPEDSLIPIKAKGEDICVPPAFVDATCDLSEFATQFDLALKKAVPELKLSSGTLWTARIVRGKKPEVEKALRGMDDLRHDHSALLDRAIEAHGSGSNMEKDIKNHQEKQQEKMNEVQELMKEYWPNKSSWILL